MKKRIIIIFIILVSLLIFISFTILTSKNLITYNLENNKLVIMAGEKIQEKNDGKNEIITIPIETDEQVEERRKKENENALAEKAAFEELVKEESVEITNITALTEEKVETDIIMNKNNELENKAVAILKKYYGNNEIETQMEQIKTDMSIVTSGDLQQDYIISENGISLIRKAFEIIDKNDASAEEKHTLIEYLKCIDPIGIKEDSELEKRMCNL